MGQTRVEQDLYVSGNLSAQTVTLPASSVTNAAIIAAAAIDATKVVQQFCSEYAQAPGSDIATATLDAHIAYAAGTLVSVQAAVTGLAATGDRSATIDLQRSTAGGAFATVLSAPITLSIADTIRVPDTATISSAAYVAGDLFRWVITQVAGSSGTRPQGLIARALFRESPQ